MMKKGLSEDKYLPYLLSKGIQGNKLSKQLFEHLLLHGPILHISVET